MIQSFLQFAEEIRARFGVHPLDDDEFRIILHDDIAQPDNKPPDYVLNEVNAKWVLFNNAMTYVFKTRRIKALVS